jgi:hypothetical protein
MARNFNELRDKMSLTARAKAEAKTTELGQSILRGMDEAIAWASDRELIEGYIANSDLAKKMTEE